MPKCMKCNGMFPPNYVENIDDKLVHMEDGEWPKECVFCKLDVNAVERETELNSGKFIRYTKEECLRDYSSFLMKMKDSKNVKEILNRKEEPRIKA